ncbi:MAG: SIS domain-containing protein [Lentisphaerae bacterium]|nr:SIS domain-containing protein [Lentisphaerota bacterium]
MKSNHWQEYMCALTALLRALSFRGAAGREIGAEAGFRQWQRLTFRVRRERKTVFLIGNGASASMASHMAADLAKNARLHTEVFSDLSLITAISNDLGYQHVFAEPLLRRARAGDMLVAISSSGASPNILAAVRVARRCRLNVVTISAMKATNPLRRSGALNVYVPAATYGLAESAHAAILHHWMNLVELGR